jgi:hypothetical protein
MADSQAPSVGNSGVRLPHWRHRAACGFDPEAVLRCNGQQAHGASVNEMWRQQWDRVNRWYGEFQLTNDGRPHTRNSDYYVDEVYAFFQNCHHLKDWLKNDPTTIHRCRDVEDVLKASVNLRLCGDLANATKHLQLNQRTHTGDRKIGFGSRHFDLELGDPPTVNVRFVVESGGQKHDAFDIATKCIEEWEHYLRTKGLL